MPSKPYEASDIKDWRKRIVGVFKWGDDGDEESKTAGVILLIVFLIGALTFYWSKRDPTELEAKATTRAAELRGLPEGVAGAKQWEHALTVYMIQDEQESFFIGVLRHISLALFVSCILILAVDTHTRRAARRDLRKHLQQVTENVFAGVSQRLLGTKTATELESILRQNFAKDGGGYQLTFLPPTEDQPPDRVVAVFESWYFVKNLGSLRDFPFEVNLMGYEKGDAIVGGKKVMLPQFEKVVIAGKDMLKELYDPSIPNRIQKQISLPEDRSTQVRIYIVVRLLYRTRQTEIFYSDTVMEGSSLTVINQAPQLIAGCKASVLHPAYDEVSEHAQNQWEFKRSLLPGQGWYLEWWPPEMLDKNVLLADAPLQG